MLMNPGASRTDFHQELVTGMVVNGVFSKGINFTLKVAFLRIAECNVLIVIRYKNMYYSRKKQMCFVEQGETNAGAYKVATNRAAWSIALLASRPPALNAPPIV